MSIWNPLNHLLERIRNCGGFVNSHAHFDRAYSVNVNDFLSDSGVTLSKQQKFSGVHSHLFEKWELVDQYKKDSSECDYENHIRLALEDQRKQGVKTCLSFIDCDPVCEMRAIHAANKLQKEFSQKYGMHFLLANQTLKGVIDPEARKWFEESLDFVDIIGGLPGKDKGKESEHLDILFQAAKETNKRVHVHVDQLNSPLEKETELLISKIEKHQLHGKVTAVHGISIAAHHKKYRHELYKKCKDVGLSFIACPSAWIDSRRNETLTPTHNAVTPLDEMSEHGIIVALGTDNICDIYKPFCNGDMTTELRILLESTHFYDMDILTKIATTNGLHVLGIEKNV